MTGIVRYYAFRHHAENFPTIVVLATSLENAQRLAEGKGADFETCDVCDDSHWYCCDDSGYATQDEIPSEYKFRMGYV